MKFASATPRGRNRTAQRARGCAYGVAWATLLAAATLPSTAQTFQELYTFSKWTDGIGPAAALVEGKDGDFYGTTEYGPGPETEDWLGYGTVFKITPQGQFTTLFAFNWTNGAYPSGALLQAADGNFYGTTREGQGSGGTLFRITPDGRHTLLAWFGGSAGAGPLGDLVEGPDGKLYGVTSEGGDTGSRGTAFRVSTNGEFQTLHFFHGDDGLVPSGGLILASDGNFYGVTALGGRCTGDGTIFRLSTNGTVTTVASFCQGPGNATWPFGKLLQAENGSFFGGAGGGWDTIFRYSTETGLTTFARFGGSPVTGMVQGRDGYIYGCTYDGGSNYFGGTVFRLDGTHGCTNNGWTTCNNFTNVFLFGETAAGWHPYAGLVQDSDGNFYGTTAFGGPSGAGSIFRINMPGPTVSVAKCGSALVLSWRTNYTGYTLQWTVDPVRGTWTECSNSISTSGRQHFVTNAISGPQRFFRLSRPTQ